MVLTKADFDQKVLESNGVVIVEFYASWCPHCQAYMPEFFQISEDLSNQAQFYQVEIDRSPELTQEFNVDSIPTLIVFYNGQEVQRLLGAQSQSTLEEIIQSY